MKKQRRLSHPKKSITKSSPTHRTKLKGPPASRPQEEQPQEDQIQRLIDLLKRNKLAELEWEYDGFRVRLRDGGEPSTTFPRPTPQAMTGSQLQGNEETFPSDYAADDSGMVTITSPIVGTFYRSPSPDADPYVEENDAVKKGQVLCIVEAMKLMNEIESEVDGRVVKILVDTTKPVEYGQPLFLIDPSPSN